MATQSENKDAQLIINLDNEICDLYLQYFKITEDWKIFLENEKHIGWQAFNFHHEIRNAFIRKIRILESAISDRKTKYESASGYSWGMY